MFTQSINITQRNTPTLCYTCTAVDMQYCILYIVDSHFSSPLLYCSVPSTSSFFWLDTEQL